MAEDGAPDIDWKGLDVVDPDGEKVGSVEEVYVERESGRPQWLLVRRGLLALGTTFVPAEGAEEDGEGTLRIPHAKQTVADAPPYKMGPEVDTEREAEIYRHYELEPPAREDADEDGDADDAERADEED